MTGFLLVATLANNSLAQEKCAVVPYQELLHKKYPKLQSKPEFENWLQEKIIKKKESVSLLRQEAEVITIPVVVHVIHNGENIGVGRNIADGQIESQIDVLNEDFRRNNADAVNTPAVFQPVAADVEIEFVLAKRDPEGLPTNGIVRVQGNQSTYDLAEQYAMKSLSYWPSEDYLNIWVADLSGSFLGYAQFPVSSLQGLEDASEYALTDGVAIDYKVMGSVEKYPPADLIPDYSLGRTGTHEVGHFLGLRHIWGDGGCSVDDFCADTPAAGNDHGGLADCDFPGPNSCGSDSEPLENYDMFQNYMDYTDDVCMNLFTLDQKARMRVVMDESPRRASLKDSKGDEPPVMAANDLGIRNIISPNSFECLTTFTPRLEVRNYGTNAITSAQISVSVDGTVEEVKNVTLNLGLLEIDTVEFAERGVTEIGNYNVSFEIVATNGVTDGNADNNMGNIDIFIPESASTPVLVDFQNGFSDWTVSNTDGLLTWEIVNAPNNQVTNQALRMEFYNYEQEGEIDLFISPSIDLSTSLSTLLTFDVAYAYYSGRNNEGLIVTASAVCGDAMSQADTVYEAYGSELSTLSSTSYFTPSGPEDWRKVQVDLSAYAGSETVKVTFIARNQFGNNLYLDNIGIVDQDVEDIAIGEILSPSLVACSAGNQLVAKVQNVGIVPINSFDFQYIVDGGSPEIISWQSGSPLLLGDEVIITVPLPDLAEGEHDISITILNPNNVVETNLANNSRLYNFVINDNADFPPIKEQFESFSLSDWTVANPDAGQTWEPRFTSKQQSIAMLGSTYGAVNQQDWLVSPVLDFRNLQTASLNFDLAYANSVNGTERLRILVSTNCGNTYDEIIFDRSGDFLATTDPVEGFIPNNNDAWRNLDVSLVPYIGQEQVRLAFVSTNNNGNNIYLDNVQVFVTENDGIEANTLYPNPTIGEPTKLSFDLKEKETITVLVYDRSGSLILEDEVPNTLNQTYEMDLTDQPEGMYIVKVVGESFSFVKRLVILK